MVEVYYMGKNMTTLAQKLMMLCAQCCKVLTLHVQYTLIRESRG